MKIVEDPGRFEIMIPTDWLPYMLLVMERGGRTCYRSEKGPITLDSATLFVQRMLKSDHRSVIEFSWLPVKLYGCSRGATHELVRHRVAVSILMESTRYVDESDLHVILPPDSTGAEIITVNDQEVTLAWLLEQYEATYRELLKIGWKPEDARQILPIGVEAEICVATNFQEWRWIFRQRTQKAAHWEIRRVMGRLLVALQELVPVVFDDFVQAGVCRHGIPYFKQVPWS